MRTGIIEISDMLKLLYTPRSPYARKVRVLAAEKHIPLECVEEDLSNKSDNFVVVNPVGKIPVLIIEDGHILTDSKVICEYLDFLKSQPVLIPHEPPQRFKILNLAAIADGLIDVTVAAFMESFRHPNSDNSAYITMSEATINRCLQYFEKHVQEVQSLSMASIALACAIGYAQFRFAALWPRSDCPQLLKWYEEFSSRQSMVLTKPMTAI